MLNALENKQNSLSCRVAVIGAGHAGIEAALASARLGVDTVLFTMSLESIANMPCNPSIGGTAKGHLVYEIDALGGEMGHAADLVTLQSRLLNMGKGVAVQSKRVQADRKKYQSIMKRTLETTPNLRLVQSEVTAIFVSQKDECNKNLKNKSNSTAIFVSGIETRLGEKWDCDCVIVATGTYLESAIFASSCCASKPEHLLASNAKALIFRCLKSSPATISFFPTLPFTTKTFSRTLSKLAVTLFIQTPRLTASFAKTSHAAPYIPARSTAQDRATAPR